MFTKSISSNNAPKAIGPYSPAVKLGDFVYVSGQLPIDVETNEFVEGGIQEQTYQVLKNLEALLAEMNLEMRHIVKTTVFMTDLSGFSLMNEIYSTYFADPYPARSTVEVKALPKGALIEIEAIVIDTLLYEQQVHEQHGHSHDHEGCSCGDDCGCDHDHEGEECSCGGDCSCESGEDSECTDGTCCG
jgi:2-iminobutanoate/2-iminopropanoate deaminase